MSQGRVLTKSDVVQKILSINLGCKLINLQHSINEWMILPNFTKKNIVIKSHNKTKIS